MDSMIRTRPSHYDVLGLTPAATSDEIAEAFSRESGPFRPRPLGGISQVFSAYEVLRDPAKRRAYDSAIGVAPAPVANASPTAAVLRGWAETARPAPVARPAPAARPDPVPERKAESIYGAAPRAPAAPRATEPNLATTGPGLEQSIEAYIARHRETAVRSLDPEPAPIEWKRPWLAIGGLLIGVGAVGALAGSWASNDIETDRIGAEAVIGPPAAEARPPASAAPAPSVAEAKPPAAPAAEAPNRIARAAPPPRPKLDEEPQLDAAAPGQSRVEEIAAALTVPESPPSAAAATATMPLPNKVVARTIERIGYACGEVASTTPVEGAGSGVFTVTCTSGQSYQARPVRGRYRFRRLGG